METVWPNALRGERARQREGARHGRHGAMERRIEAGHLRQVGLDQLQRPDRREIVRLMQRRQRNPFLKPCQHGGIDGKRRGKRHSAMHHPMADGGEAQTGRHFAYPREQPLERLRAVARAQVFVQRMDGETARGRGRHAQARRLTDALDAAAASGLRCVRAIASDENGEPEAGGAGIEDEHGLIHRASPVAGARPSPRRRSGRWPVPPRRCAASPASQWVRCGTASSSPAGR